MICLFDKDDELMLHAKEGNWWETNPQRGLSNNSVQFDRDNTTREDFDKIFAQCQASGCGEPGVVWSNVNDWLVNPCCEISMPSNGFCNLTSVNLGSVESQEDFNERAYYASVLGTLQAAYTDFKYIDPNWKKTAEDMALIGVSLTGIASHPDLSALNFKEAAGSVKEANKYIADKIGIKTADRLTTVKPDGTGSLVLGTSSGVHPWHAKHYIRRLRVNKMEPLYAYMVENFPELVEDEEMNPGKNAVVSLVIRAPEGAVTRRNETAIEFLERVKYIFENWVVPGHVAGCGIIVTITQVFHCCLILIHLISRHRSKIQTKTYIKNLQRTFVTCIWKESRKKRTLLTLVKKLPALLVDVNWSNPNLEYERYGFDNNKRRRYRNDPAESKQDCQQNSSCNRNPRRTGRIVLCAGFGR